MILPLIAKSDYAAFQKIMGGELPPTYEAWLEIRDTWKQNHPDARYVNVDPDQFSKFLQAKATLVKHGVGALIDFANAFAKGEAY